MFRTLLALVVTSCALASEPGWQATFPGLPATLAEQQRGAVTVAYRLPGGAATTLRCELKTLEHVVLQSRSERVTGSGQVVFQFDLPPVATARFILFAAWMGDDWQASPCGVTTSSPVRLLRAAEAADDARQRTAAEQWAARQSGRRPVAVYAPGGAAAGELLARLSAAGLPALPLDAVQLSNRYLLRPARIELLLVTDSRRLPAAAAASLADYVGEGGKIILLNGPAWSLAEWQLGDRWLTQDAWRDAVAAQVKPTIWRDFEGQDIGVWRRSTNDSAAPSTIRRTTGAFGSQGAVEFDVAKLSGWDTFELAGLEHPFSAGHTWTCFSAKGDATTTELAVEWREQDGSRWIATVPLSPTWRRYVLPPTAFAHWRDTSRQDRGGTGDHLQPAHAAAFSVGLAFTHTHSVHGGPHKFWLDDLGSAPADDAIQLEALSGKAPDWPALEGVSPAYKLYPVTNLARLRPAGAPAPSGELIATALLSPHPRPAGTGIDKHRPRRWMPLVEALDARGRVVGEAAALCLNATGERGGGQVATVPVTDPEFLTRPANRDWLAQLAARMVDGVFLTEGGAKWFATVGAENVPVGFAVTNRGHQPVDAEVECTVAAGGRTVWQKVAPVSLPAGRDAAQAFDWPVPGDAPGPFTVTVTLRRGGQVIDRLQHEVIVSRPPAKPAYVERRDGQLYLNGRPWRVHGVNYMPSTGIGLEHTDTRLFELWLAPESYDPEVVERDLTDIQEMGFNVVSAFIYHESLAGRNLLDFLWRCERHGLKVNLSLRPGTPLDFEWDKMREIVQTSRLAASDTVYAYDLAWEPQWGLQAARRRWDGEWAKWIDRRYGSLAQAEQAWGGPAPRQDGRLTNPTDQQTGTRGAHDQLVSDYRRFLNDLLADRYGHARELLRSIDPHHLVSFRMSSAGDPTVNPNWLAYDFAGLARAVDLLEPEGYGRIGDWERVKAGWFTAAYGRAVAPGLPLVWAEFGTSVWDPNLGAPNPQALETVAQFYDDFYRMIEQSGVSGSICWWFPGGYRVNERSDYGIVNPDRSWRRITDVIHRWAPRLTAPTALPADNVWLPIVADHPWGIAGVYRDVATQFWALAAAGQRPGLKVSGATPAQPRP